MENLVENIDNESKKDEISIMQKIKNEKSKRFFIYMKPTLVDHLLKIFEDEYKDQYSWAEFLRMIIRFFIKHRDILKRQDEGKDIEAQEDIDEKVQRFFVYMKPGLANLLLKIFEDEYKDQYSWAEYLRVIIRFFIKYRNREKSEIIMI